jgi:predicted NACHT family NTPase
MPQVHEIPKEYQKQLQEDKSFETRISPENLEKYRKTYYRQTSRWVFDIFDDKNVQDKEHSRYVVILGAPGSGKSTLLQYIALEWTELAVKKLCSLPIPLLIELRTYIRNRNSR